MINRRIVSLGTRFATICSRSPNPQLSSEEYTSFFRSLKRKLPKTQRDSSEVRIALSCLFAVAYGCCFSLAGNEGRPVRQIGEPSTFCLGDRAPTSTPSVTENIIFAFCTPPLESLN